MKNPPLVRPQKWFTLFVFYNLTFLVLQIAFNLSTSSSFLNTLPLPRVVYLELIITLFIHLGLYLILSALQAALIWGLMQYHLTTASLERWHLAIWSLSLGALLSSNGYFFPLSAYSRLFLPEVPQAVLIIFMLFSVLILSLLTLNTLFFAGKLYRKITCASSFIILSLFAYNNIKFNTKNIPSEKANIIFIGVDSLSPSSISTEHTPTIARFTKNSVVFKETISPLARTNPAWSSILTGLYPQHHRAFYNLMPPDLVKNSLSIAWTLQNLGYQTLFATDDRRFNTMGEEFGFQKIIGPKLGINDFLLGTFNDFPLSNLLVNLPISRWLFPYNYINRASYLTYYPQSFSNALHDDLASRSHTSPLFMAVHFTLPHWPYAWAQSSAAQVNDEYSVDEREQLYLAALQQVDKQVANILRVLQQYGYLENSLVVLLSDHGEALYVPGSRQTSLQNYQGKGTSSFADYLKRKTSTALNMSAGHGSDLLSTIQYHCLLAFKIYKHHQLQTLPKIIKTRVALIDLAPTVQAFLDIRAHHQMDGLSLLNTIVTNHETLPERAFIMESGMLPNQFLTREKARILGSKLFIVDQQTGHMRLRKSVLPYLNALKLYAIIEGNWIVALYPDDNGYIPVTLHLTDGKWIDDINTDFAKSSPADSMLNYLQQFYKKKWNLVSSKTKSPT